MNRQQRRQAVKQARREQNTREVAREAADKATVRSINLLYDAFAIALNELYGLDAGQIQEVFVRTDEIMVDAKGDIKATESDLRRKVQEEIGLTINV